MAATESSDVRALVAATSTRRADVDARVVRGEAADEVSAIVAAFAYFLWRQAPVWRECACGCGLTFINNGKQRYIERNQAAQWQRDFRRRRARQKQQGV